MKSIEIPVEGVVILSTLATYGAFRLFTDLGTKTGACSKEEALQYAKHIFETQFKQMSAGQDHYLDFDQMYAAFREAGRDGIARYLEQNKFAKPGHDTNFLTDFVFFPRIKVHHHKVKALTKQNERDRNKG